MNERELCDCGDCPECEIRRGPREQQQDNDMEEICSGCKNEIDPNCCHCGTDLKQHDSWGDGHAFTPQGCCCGYANTIRCQFCEKLRPFEEWKNDICPCCGRKYDAMLAQEGDD